MSTQTPLPSSPDSRWIKRLERLLAWLEAVLGPVMNPIRVLWLTGFCTIFFAVGVIFFLLNDQGMDVLRRLVEARGWRGLLGNLFFFASVLAWGLSTWYSGRLLLTRRFRYTDANFFQATRTLRTWLPRIEGSVVALVIAGGFWRVGSWSDAGAVPYMLVAIYVALGIVLLVFFWKRRAMFPALVQGGAPDEVVDRLPPASLTTLWVAFALSWGLLMLFLISPLRTDAAWRIRDPAVCGSIMDSIRQHGLDLLAAGQWLPGVDFTPHFRCADCGLPERQSHDPQHRSAGARHTT